MTAVEETARHHLTCHQQRKILQFSQRFTCTGNERPLTWAGGRRSRKGWEGEPWGGALSGWGLSVRSWAASTSPWYTPTKEKPSSTQSLSSAFFCQDTSKCWEYTKSANQMLKYHSRALSLATYIICQCWVCGTHLTAVATTFLLGSSS